MILHLLCRAVSGNQSVTINETISQLLFFEVKLSQGRISDTIACRESNNTPNLAARCVSQQAAGCELLMELEAVENDVSSSRLVVCEGNDSRGRRPGGYQASCHDLQGEQKLARSIWVIHALFGAIISKQFERIFNS
jgi:hypothetical protein